MASLRIHICYLVIFAGLFIPTSCLDHCWLPQKHVALFIFGDSLFDVGNNNYFNTTIQANFYPYGETFFKYPTGRFSDGRVIPDFIAEFAKLPLIPPYLHPAIHQFTDGVSFASAGAGALDATRRGFVINLKTQRSYFKNVEKRLTQKIGDEEAKKLLSRAVYLFSIGSSDYSVYRYFSQSYSQEEYIGMVIGNVTSAIEEIYKKGGRKFGFLTLGRLGCSAAIRALNGSTGACNEELNTLAKLHNTAFSQVLQKLESKLKGFKYSIFNIYDFSPELTNNPSKYGFKDAKNACCGSGPFRGLGTCGGKGEVINQYELCDNPSEHLSFDSRHPTEKADQIYAELMWSGPPNITGPYNLQALFEQ